MKLSEVKGEKALDILADLLEPVLEISADEELVSELQSGSRVKGIQLMLKNHKKSVITMLALLNEEDVNTYEPNLLTLPKTLLELVSDEEVMSLFFEQGQSNGLTPFGSVTENTEASEK